MKVKNIMFSGFAAAILMGVAAEANAAPAKVVASKGYVDAITGQLEGLTGAAAHKANLVDAVNVKLDPMEALNDAVPEGKFYAGVAQTAEGKVSVVHKDLSTTISQGVMIAPTTDAVHQAIAEVEGQTVDLDLEAVGGTGQYVMMVKQDDGQVTATAGVIDTAMNRESANPVTNAAITTALAFKQDMLNDTEMAAVRSGITSDKVTQYDGYATSKQNTLEGAQLQAVNSGITADKVTQYDGYATSKQDKLTAGDFIDIAADGTITTKYTAGNNIAIGTDGKISTDFPDMPDACSATGVTCVLTSENGAFAWAILAQPYTYVSGDVVSEEAITNLGYAAQDQKIPEQLYRQ